MDKLLDKLFEKRPVSNIWFLFVTINIIILMVRK